MHLIYRPALPVTNNADSIEQPEDLLALIKTPTPHLAEDENLGDEAFAYTFENPEFY